MVPQARQNNTDAHLDHHHFIPKRRVRGVADAVEGGRRDRKGVGGPQGRFR
jgi:hypothetical protein